MTDLFWSLFPPGTKVLLSEPVQHLLELVPWVVGLAIILVLFVLLSQRKGGFEEPEEIVLTELDREIEVIRKLQKEKGI